MPVAIEVPPLTDRVRLRGIDSGATLAEDVAHLHPIQVWTN
jgi:hypothetical protein